MSYEFNAIKDVRALEKRTNDLEAENIRAGKMMLELFEVMNLRIVNLQNQLDEIYKRLATIEQKEISK